MVGGGGGLARVSVGPRGLRMLTAGLKIGTGNLCDKG